MSMTEPTTEAPPTKKAPARKRARAKAKPAAAVAVPKGSIMEGLSVSECPDACGERGCVISGAAICAHPGKGGLQATLQNPGSLQRFAEAKRYLGQAKLDLTK